jgi:NADPH:quinone reductase-like Zn-dependent oxidoreductase
VDVVLDVVGGPDVGNWLGVLTRRGRYVVAGAIAGPVVPLDLRTVYLNDLTLAGVTTYGPDLFQRLVEIVESGSVSPVVSGVYSLRNIHRAQEDFMAKRHVGALVLLPDPV